MKKIIYTLFIFPLFIFAQELSVASGGTLTISTTGSMTVSSTINVNSNGNLIIETSRTASGSLIAKSAGANQGKGITLKREVDQTQAGGLSSGGSTAEWTLLGIPVTNEQVADIDDDLRTSGSKSAIGYFAPTTAQGEYVYFNTDDTSVLVNARGYLVSPSASGYVNITGTMPSTSVLYDLEDGTGTYGNWNLVGNPYPSYLNMTDDSGDASNNFLTVNTSVLDASYQSVYAWDGSAWDIYNQTTDNINHIAPGEGFFVYSVSGGGELTFRENMQSSGQGVNFNDANVAPGGNPVSNNRVSRFELEISDSDNNQTDITKFYFSDENQVSKGLDPGYDAGQFFQGNNSRIFTRLVNDDKGTNFSIQALPYNDLKDIVVPLGITTQSSSLQLSVTENSIDDYYRIYLEDKLENTIVELDRTIDLNFENDNSDGLGRFYLHFTDGMIPELPTDGDDFRIFKVSNSEIKLMGSPETIYNAKIFDFSGRLIKEVVFKHKVNINDINNNGIKILTIESSDEKITKKFNIR